VGPRLNEIITIRGWHLSTGKSVKFGFRPAANPKLIHIGKAPTYNVWVGSGPLVGYSDWRLNRHRLTLWFGPRTKYGYVQKVFWQLNGRASAPVALVGRNLKTQQRIWFGRPLTNNGLERVVAWPSGLVRSHFVGGSRGPSFTFVPASGCYIIQAHWRGGSWTIPFSAGAAP
jgi:hypothetical protein